MSGEGANVYHALSAIAAPATSGAYKIYGTRNATVYMAAAPAGTATATVVVQVSPQSGTPTIWIPALWLPAPATSGSVGLTTAAASYVAFWSGPIVQIRFNATAVAGGTLDVWLQVEM